MYQYEREFYPQLGLENFDRIFSHATKSVEFSLPNFLAWRELHPGFCGSLTDYGEFLAAALYGRNDSVTLGIGNYQGIIEWPKTQETTIRPLKISQRQVELLDPESLSRQFERRRLSRFYYEFDFEDDQKSAGCSYLVQLLGLSMTNDSYLVGLEIKRVIDKEVGEMVIFRIETTAECNFNDRLSVLFIYPNNQYLLVQKEGIVCSQGKKAVKIFLSEAEIAVKPAIKQTEIGLSVVTKGDEYELTLGKELYPDYPQALLNYFEGLVTPADVKMN